MLPSHRLVVAQWPSHFPHTTARAVHRPTALSTTERLNSLQHFNTEDILWRGLFSVDPVSLLHPSSGPAQTAIPNHCLACLSSTHTQLSPHTAVHSQDLLCPPLASRLVHHPNSLLLVHCLLHLEPPSQHPIVPHLTSLLHPSSGPAQTAIPNHCFA